MNSTTRFIAKESIEENRASHSLWNVLLDEPLRSKAAAASLWVAEHLCDPAYVQQIAILAKEQSASPQWDHSHPWTAAELALFYWHVAYCFPEQDWQTVAQRYLKLVATRSQQQNLSSPGLFGGVSGIALVIQHFSKTGQHYQQTLARLHQSVAEQVSRRSSWRLPPKTGVVESDIDLITGAAGIIGYLASIPTPDSVVQDTLRTLLAYLLALTEPGQALGKERWFSPPSLLITEQARQDYPCGRFNCGLAHGIAGPLAALSLIAMAGYEAPGLRESIAYVSQWLVDHQIHDEWGITWPAAIPYELASSPERWRSLPGARTAWCYGAPGIARSLWLAGLVLKEERLMDIALDALKAVFRRPEAARNIAAPILCHGSAGLLLICLHFAHESQDPFILEQIPHLVERILEQFDPQSPLGFRNIEPGGRLVDQPDLLTGAAGTALALLAAICEVAPSWDRLLLLS